MPEIVLVAGDIPVTRQKDTYPHGKFILIGKEDNKHIFK